MEEKLIFEALYKGMEAVGEEELSRERWNSEVTITKVVALTPTTWRFYVRRLGKDWKVAMGVTPDLSKAGFKIGFSVPVPVDDYEIDP